ncbi:MAG: tetratricopeptide repeat protein [Alphaproteobacteria bacterium]|nr:tetratricopeptide repeat protein [Alphaproteobacteria bacterium]
MSEDLAALEAFGLAVVLAARGHVGEAARHYRHALTLDPAFGAARYNLANLYQAAGLLDEAEPQYRAIPASDPHFVAAACNLGALLAHRGRLGEAAESYAAALAVNAELVPARYGYARTLLLMRQPAEAAVEFRKLLRLQPGNLSAREGLGLALERLGRCEEAIEHLLSVSAARPEDANVIAGLGGVLARLGRYAEAERSLRRALDLEPERPRHHAGLGAFLHAQGRLGEALVAYRGAVALNPRDAELRCQLAAVQLARSDFVEGWANLESRLERTDSVLTFIPTDKPVWSGCDPAGRTLVLYPERGLGEAILSARFVSVITQKGATVVVAAPPELLPLLSSLQGVQAFTTLEGPWPAHHEHAPFLSLPHRLGITERTIPADVPYLAADAGRVAWWGKRLGNRTGRRVGIVWQSDQTSSPHRDGSIPLSILARLAEVPDVTLYSLQRGAGRQQLAALKGEGQVVDLCADFDDEGAAWHEIAAVMMHLDLVIAVDGTQAHLAGALGVPVWVLLDFASGWPWPLGHTDSPWYPTARLLHQSVPGQWETVMTEAVGLLVGGTDARDQGPSRSPLIR